MLAGLQEYQFQQESGGNLSREDLVDTVRRAIQRASALTANDLKKGVSALATIGATAPFVGLLGTVVGIINAFQGIAATGSGGLGAVSAGISEALVETALGLVVAIPAVWFYNYLTGRIEYFNVEMDNSSSELRRLLHQEDRVSGLERSAPGRLTLGAIANSRTQQVTDRQEIYPWQWMLAAPKAASSRTSTSRRSSTSCWCC